MNKIKLEIVALSSSEANLSHFTLILDEVDGNRRLPIVIGVPEAQAIALQVEGITTSRPMTHDLIKNICDLLHATMEEVVITSLVEGTFYAKLILQKEGDYMEIDCRPSDGIALAVRFKAPIYIYESILDEAAVEKMYDEGEDDEEKRPSRRRAPEPRKEATSPKNLSEKIEELNKKLEEALKNEDYEQAAKLRDIIRRISDS